MYSYDRTRTASGIQIHNVEFASGQEPDDSLEVGEGFASLVRVDFTVSGRDLAKLLGKQERTLEKALKDMSPRQILKAAEDNRDVLRAVTPAVKRMVQSYASSVGGRVRRLDVTFASESDLAYRVKIDPRKQTARFELEFDVDAS